MSQLLSRKVKDRDTQTALDFKLNLVVVARKGTFQKKLSVT